MVKKGTSFKNYDSQENDSKSLIIRPYLYGMNNSKDLKVHFKSTDIIRTWKFNPKTRYYRWDWMSQILNFGLEHSY